MIVPYALIYWENLIFKGKIPNLQVVNIDKSC